MPNKNHKMKPMSKKFKYTNNSESKQAIIGIGEVEPGKTIESESEINNPNFSMVGIDPVTKPNQEKKSKSKKSKKDK
jgi:hypothetical protein